MYIISNGRTLFINRAAQRGRGVAMAFVAVVAASMCVSALIYCVSALIYIAGYYIGGLL